MIYVIYSIGTGRRMMQRPRGICILGRDFNFPYWLQRRLAWRPVVK